MIPSVTVRPIDDAKLEEIADSLAADEEQLILALDARPTFAGEDRRGARLGDRKGQQSAPESKVNRALSRLVSLRLAEKDRRDKYHLAEKGKKGS